MAISKEEKPVRSVRIQNFSLDERKDAEGNKTIVGHGWLGTADLEHILVGDYQREILNLTTTKTGGKRSRLLKAVQEGAQLPDIMLGMRGERFSTRGHNAFLEDDVYVVDGLQRISAMRYQAMNDPDSAVNLRIGAEVRFSTNRESEKELFTALNLNRTAMSPNVILRNMRETNKAVLTLFGLSNNDVSFPLYGKVQWNQNMNRSEIVSALLVSKAVLNLHRFDLAKGGRVSGGATDVRSVASRLELAAGAVSLSNFRANIHAFFSTLDEIWGIKGIKYADPATHLRGNFLNVLAQFMSDHANFWDGKKLVVDSADRSKLRAFPIDDPSIAKLAAGGIMVAPLLYNYMRDHFNKNRRTNRLVTRSREE